MARRRLAGLPLAAALAAILTGAPAFAHGGQYRPPPDGPGSKDATDPPPPDGGGGTPTPEPPPPPPDGGGGTPTVNPDPPPRDGGGGTPTPPPNSGGPVPRAPGTGQGRTATPAPWERWWSVHQERLLALRSRIRARDAGTATPAPTPRPEVVDPAAAQRASVEAALRALLSDRDAEVRSAAAVALGKQGSPRALADLLRLRADRVRDVREGGLLGASMLGEPLAAEDLVEVLFDPAADLREREFAALGLGLLRSGGSTAALLRFLDPAADRERLGGLRRTDGLLAATVVALGVGGDPAPADVLRAAYASPTRLPERARCLAAVALARLGDHRSLPLFRQALSQDAEPLRASACTAIGLLARPEDVDALASVARIALEDHAAEVRLAAQAALARVATDPARAALRRVLERGKEMDAPMAALCLGVAGDGTAAPDLLRRFRREGDPDRRGAYALALGLLSHRDAARDLRETAFSRGDAGLRAHCLTAVGLVGDAPSAPAARAVIAEERDPDLRLAAALCLGLLGDRAVVGEVEGMVGGGRTTWERAASCVLLGLVGDRGSATLLMRVSAARDEPGPVRAFAAAALGTLTAREDLHPLARVAEDNFLDGFPGALGDVSSLL